MTTTLIDQIDYEAVLAERKAQFLELVPAETRDAIAAALELESEPLAIFLQDVAYHEVVRRQRENDAILSNLLRFATGERLDELARWYQLERLDGELDDRFRLRLELHIRGLSGMGTEDYYRARALGVALWVRDAHVAADRFGTLHIALWLTTDAPSDALEQASASLTDKRRRMATDTVLVTLAISRPLLISATLYRAAGVPAARVDDARTALATALSDAVGLGASIAINWIVGRLSLDGIADIVLDAPTTNIACAGNEYPVVTAFDVRDGGLR